MFMLCVQCFFFLYRQGPIEVDIEMANALEEPLANDLQICEDSDSEEGDSFPVEWEAVSNFLNYKVVQFKRHPKLLLFEKLLKIY